MRSETVEIGWGQTVKHLEDMLRSKEDTMKTLMRCAKLCGTDMVGLREPSYKCVHTVKDGRRETY